MKIIDSECHQQPIRYSKTRLVTAIASVLIGINVHADSNEVKALEEIIVTATKREVNMQNVAQSISALSSDDLKKMRAIDMKGVINAFSGVSMVTSQPQQNEITMRGLTSGTGEWYSDSQVAVYLDEQPMTTASQQVNIRGVDMERIESLQGPQGTMYGSSSQAGTIRYISNKPNHNGISGQLETSYGFTEGGDDSYDLNGHLNIPLIDDQLAMRVVAYQSRDGGYVDNLYGQSLSGNFDNADLVGGVGGVDKNQNEASIAGGRIAFLWEMADDWSGLLTVVGEQSKYDGHWDTDPSLGDHKITAFADDQSDSKWYSAAFNLTGDLGFAELSATVTHLERDISYLHDQNVYNQYKDRTYHTVDAAYPSRYDTDYNRSLWFNEQNQERDALEIRLASLGDSRLSWVAGVFYEDVYDEWYAGTVHENLADTASAAAASAYVAYNQLEAEYLSDPNVSYGNIFERTVQQTALFAEVSYDISDHFALRVGSRWSEYKRDTSDAYYYPFKLDESENTRSKIDDSIYKVALQYQIDDDRMVYALYSQGFRLGGQNAPRAVASGFVNQTYDSDTLDNYELGIKSQWFDNRLQVNSQLFHMVWSDYQTNISGDDNWYDHGTVNAGDAEVTGLELDIALQASENLKIKANVFFARPEFKDDIVYSAAPDQQAFLPNGDENPNFDGYDIEAGMRMPNSPKYKGWLSINYDIPDLFGGDAWVYFETSYQAESWNEIYNIPRKDDDNDGDNDGVTEGLSKPYSVSSLSFGVDMPNDLSVTLLLDNVFDKATSTYVSTGNNDNADAFGDSRWHNTQSFERPRTFWVTLRKDF